jgi:hypothetical protein
MEEIIKSKWEFLLQCKPEIRTMIGNYKLVGGHISHNSRGEKLTHTLITTTGPSTESKALTGAYEMFLPRLSNTIIMCPKCEKFVELTNHCSNCGANLK